METNTVFSDEVFVPLLMKFLENVELHKVADNEYVVFPKFNRLIVSFVVSGKDIDVCISYFGIAAVNMGRLSLSPESKQKMLQVLETRKQSCSVKRLNADDFDRLLNVLKNKYIHSSKEMLDSIDADFVRNLIYAFSAIPGKREYISIQEGEKLRMLLRQRRDMFAQQKLNQQGRQKGS